MRRDEALLQTLLERAAQDGGTPATFNRIELFHFAILLEEGLVEFDRSGKYYITDRGLNQLHQTNGTQVRAIGDAPTADEKPESSMLKKLFRGPDDIDARL